MGLRLMWIGTYESDYPRTRVLISGLRELGVEVVECHRPVWELTRHKAGEFLSPSRLPVTAGRFATAWAQLALEQRRAGPVDALVTGYPAQLDTPFAAACARARRVPLIVDAMISLSDTLLGDRGRVGSLAGASLERLDRLAVRRADLLMTDTESHAAYFASQFDADRRRIAAVPVGAEPDLFPRTPQPSGEVHALFYGKLSPLHGLETVLAAARMPGVPPLRLVGDGQLRPWLDAELAHNRPPGLEHVSWVPYERLGGELGAAAICLGIFGTSEKARRVVPNKVYQAMAVGRPIVTADTPAVRETLTDGENAILVPAGDPEALAAATIRLADDAELRARLGENAWRRFQEVGAPIRVARRFLESLSDGALDLRRAELGAGALSPRQHHHLGEQAKGEQLDPDDDQEQAEE
jgi:glycosyltransferase involved in cell wall biosynthesis